MINLRKTTSALTALFLAATLSSCGNLRGQPVETGMDNGERVSSNPEDASSQGQGETIAVDTPEVTAQAFTFQANELFSGATVLGADVYTSGPVILTFVSPGCLVSVEQGPELAKAAEANSDITYVFAHIGGDQDSYEQFVDDADLYQQNAIHIDDTGQALWNRFGLQITPSSVLVDTEGTTRFTTGGLDHEGLRDAADLVRGTI